MHGAAWRPFKYSLEMHGAAWSLMEPHCRLQILLEPHRDFEDDLEIRLGMCSCMNWKIYWVGDCSWCDWRTKLPSEELLGKVVGLSNVFANHAKR